MQIPTEQKSENYKYSANTNRTEKSAEKQMNQQNYSCVPHQSQKKQQVQSSNTQQLVYMSTFSITGVDSPASMWD